MSNWSISSRSAPPSCTGTVRGRPHCGQLICVPDFRRAYEPDGLAVEEFAGYGATVRTLRTFIAGYHDLQAAVRDVILPNPDIRAG